MARRGRTGRRDTNVIANAPSLSSLTVPSFATRAYLAELSQTQAHLDWMREIEDDRTYHPVPAGVRSKTVTGRAALLGRRFLPVLRSPTAVVGLHGPRRFQVPRARLPVDVPAFRDASRVITCVRRKVRKEVLHALRKTGGGGGRKPPRFRWQSRVRC